jgi:hypothetical protein
VINEDVCSLDEVIEYIYAWGDRKRKFTLRQITLATEVLTNKQ